MSIENVFELIVPMNFQSCLWAINQVLFRSASPPRVESSFVFKTLYQVLVCTVPVGCRGGPGTTSYIIRYYHSE